MTLRVSQFYDFRIVSAGVPRDFDDDSVFRSSCRLALERGLTFAAGEEYAVPVVSKRKRVSAAFRQQSDFERAERERRIRMWEESEVDWLFAGLLREDAV